MPFGKDDRPFALHFFRVQRGVDHAICFDGEGKVDAIGRKDFEESGAIVPRETVAIATVGGNEAMDCPFGEARGAIEEEVLDPVSEACFPCYLVTRADVIEDVEGDNRRSVVFT